MRRLLPPLALALVLAGCSIGGDGGGSEGPAGLAAAPTASEGHAAAQLGFPTVATRNTIRVGGGDAVADLAGVAAAVFPSTGKLDRPHAVVLVDKNDWQGAVAGSLLNAQPLGAPLLASDGGSLPAATPDALNRLKPSPSAPSRGPQAIRIGPKPPPPAGLKTGETTSAR